MRHRYMHTRWKNEHPTCQKSVVNRIEREDRPFIIETLH